MSKTWTILKYELLNTLSRRSFLLMLILVPLIPGLIVGVLGVMNPGQRESVQEVFTPGFDSPLPFGYVDQGNLIQALPEWLPAGALEKYTQEDDAKADLLAGKLNAYYIIPKDYLQKGEITIIRQDANPVTSFSQNAMFDEVLKFNLLNADPELYNAYNTPALYQYINLAPQTETRDKESPLALYLPYGITMLFYILIMMTASLLLNNVNKEKENRVMEVLLTSLKPVQLFTGKIIALGLAGLLQLVVWLGSAAVILKLGGSTLRLPEGFQLSPSLILFGVVFFVLGYAIYGSLMAGVGALVPNLKEASQATTMMIIPLIIPLMFFNALLQDPNGSLAVFLSLFPLTAPVAMMTRLATGIAPFWQAGISALLCLVLVFIIVRSVSNLFRAQVLLTGQKFSPKSFITALFAKD